MPPNACVIHGGLYLTLLIPSNPHMHTSAGRLFSQPLWIIDTKTATNTSRMEREAKTHRHQRTHRLTMCLEDRWLAAVEADGVRAGCRYRAKSTVIQAI